MSNFNANYQEGGLQAVNTTMRKGCLTRFYKNMDNGAIVALSIYLVTQDAMTGIDMGDFLSQTFSKEDVFYSSGVYGDLVPVQQEVKANEMSISILEDFNYLQDDNNYIEGQEKNLAHALLLGQSVIIGGVVYSCVGTNGVTKHNHRIPVSDQNKEWFYAVYNEGAFLRTPGATDRTTGLPLKQLNNFKETFDLEAQAFMYEQIVSRGTGVEITMLPLVYYMTMTKDEGNTNKITFNCKKVCDPTIRNEFMFDGVSKVQTITDTNIKELAVDYIVQNEAGSEPSDSGTEGEVAAVINTATGNVQLYKVINHSGLKWKLEAGAGRFVTGARIYSKKLTSDTIDNANINKGSYIVAIKTPSKTSPEGIAAKMHDGGTANYVLSNLAWNRFTKALENKVD